MLDKTEINSFNQLVSNANTIVLVLKKAPTLDEISTAASLNISLVNMGKEVTFVTPEKLTNDYPNVSGLESLKTKLGSKNMVVSFDYDENKVDKVSYHIGEDGKKFYLTIKPKKGSKPLDKDTVTIDYVDAEADLIILVGVHDLESLDNLYVGFENFYLETDTIVIHKFKPLIGRVKINTTGFVCISEALAQLYQELNYEIDSNIATNLMMSIEQTTDSFRSLSTTPKTFELASYLMKAGARRIRKESVKQKQIKTKQILPMNKSNLPKKTRVKNSSQLFSDVLAEKTKVKKIK